MLDFLDVSNEQIVQHQGSYVVWADQPIVAVPQSPALKVWQDHHAGGGKALSRMPEGQVFDSVFLSDIRDVLAHGLSVPVVLIFVTSGYQPQYRSPVLPWLLGSLPEFHNVYALRAHGEDLPSVAQALMNSTLKAGVACLLIQDLSRRLIAEADPDLSAGKMKFQYFTPICCQELSNDHD